VPTVSLAHLEIRDCLETTDCPAHRVRTEVLAILGRRESVAWTATQVRWGFLVYQVSFRQAAYLDQRDPQEAKDSPGHQGTLDQKVKLESLELQREAAEKGYQVSQVLMGHLDQEAWLDPLDQLCTKAVLEHQEEKVKKELLD